MIDLLKKLTALNGPCGYEHHVTYFIRDYVKHRADEVTVDGLGSVLARKKGNRPGPVLLFTAHMDEVGFIVKKIEDNGLLRFEKLGGNDDRTLLAQPVKVLAENNEIDGVIGTMSAHYVKFDDPAKVRKHSQLYIDIGVTSKEEAKALGVEVGTPITWATQLKVVGPEQNRMVISKALDDRAGCTVLLQVLNELQGKDFAGEIVFLFTVQEEVGLRGAKAATNLLKVDAAVAVDTTAVSDTLEETMDQSLALGKGAGIKVMDFSLIVHKTMKKMLVETAKKHHIPYQLEVFTGIGTDGGAASLAGKGVPTGVLSVPSRYAHSPVEMANVADLEATKELLKQFALSVDEHTSFAF
ncbi:M42 family metallopeptidase [Heyndrickxia coagulans]|uniref:M42 family metallopeptidase n=1 Tax=Heyndrickxia coagulans TaxID=1398 RepID=UPI002236685D|nr:M42 family metallopeptidase [Heyndrickxia coagulans]UZH06075.1 M42 family metallopeptidase [Heyndrickxia coagulans]